MSKPNADQPAFPQPEHLDAGANTGLTKREYFEAIILSGIMSNEHLVQTCIEFAARGKTNPEAIMVDRAFKLSNAYFEAKSPKQQKPQSN